MGSYTPKQRFYQIDGSDLVNVDNDINYNLMRADERVRSLIEYQVTDPTITSITDSPLHKDTGYKFYKPWSNSIWVATTAGDVGGGAMRQDDNARVDSWTTNGLTFESGYGSLDLDKNRVSYTIWNNFVRFRGKVVFNSGNSDLVKNTSTRFLTVPSTILPSDGKARYIMVSGGDVANDIYTARIFIPPGNAADLRLEFCMYGGTASGTTNRYLSLNGIFYHRQVP